MPKKKEDYPKLTYGKIIKANPDREGLSGGRQSFKELVSKAAETPPFDKKDKE